MNIDDEEERERYTAAHAARQVSQLGIAIPPIDKPKSWEYEEDTEELGIMSVFGEVGFMATNFKSLREAVTQLQGTFDNILAVNTQAVQQKEKELELLAASTRANEELAEATRRATTASKSARRK
jgi:hypothetical protein